MTGTGASCVRWATHRLQRSWSMHHGLGVCTSTSGVSVRLQTFTGLTCAKEPSELSRAMLWYPRRLASRLLRSKRVDMRCPTSAQALPGKRLDCGHAWTFFESRGVAHRWPHANHGSL